LSSPETTYNVNSKSRVEKMSDRKHFVEHGLIWKPRLYVGASFRSESVDVNEIETKAQSWLRRLCRYTNNHGVMDAVSGHSEWLKSHWHATVCLEKPVPVDVAKSLWHEGWGSFQLYNSKLAGVIYNHSGHDDMFLLGDVACHCNRGACRRNRCPYQSGKISITRT